MKFRRTSMQIQKIITTTLKTKPAETSLPFGKYFTDHMFVMTYTKDKGWFNPTIKPHEPLQLDPSAMVLHQGQAIFEGMKCYRAEGGRLLLFRPERNFARLNASGERMNIPPIDEAFALKALSELIKTDTAWVPSAPGTTLYIRPFIIATEEAIGVRVSSSYQFIIILSPVGAYYAEGLSPTKIYIEEEYVRAVRGGVGFAKAAGNYAASLKGQQKAAAKGYTQTMWLDAIERKYIEEVGTSNVFFKIAGEIITPALSGSILPGITRDSAIQLLRHKGLTVTERAISVDELYATHQNGTLEETFATGTAAAVSPIGEFMWGEKIFAVGNDGIGETTQWLYDTLTGIQYGRVKDEFGWVHEVK